VDETTAEIVSFYTGYDEAGRLDRRPSFRLERMRTLELLERHLPTAPATILDIGGGPGAYARPLMAAGHRVRLVDLVPSHVDQALAGVPPVDAVVGDARSLPEPDGAYDATLLLGPLYHLLDRGDRVRAIREAVRVTRPGGTIVAAAISRFAGGLDFGVTGRLDERTLDEARRLTVDGVNDAGFGFTQAYFHRVEELVAEFRDAGLPDAVVHGVEGPLWTAAEAAGTAEMFTAALELARVYSTEPALVASSAHLIVVTTVP